MCIYIHPRIKQKNSELAQINMEMRFAKLHEEFRRIDEAFPIIVLMIYSGHTHVVEYRTRVSNCVNALAETARMSYATEMRSHIDALLKRARSLDWALDLLLARPRDDRAWGRRGRFSIGPSSGESSSGAASPLGSGDGGRSSPRP
jgi:hypothetical protein